MLAEAFSPPAAELRRRVVITGVGAVCSLGIGVKCIWHRFLAGETGLRRLQESDLPEDQRSAYNLLPACLVGKVPQAELQKAFQQLQHLQKNRQTPPFVAFAEIAATHALEHANGPLGTCVRKDARWAPTEVDDRSGTGVSIGSGLSFTGDLAGAGILLANGHLRRLSPHFVPRVLGNMAAGHVSMRHGLRGPNLAPACAGAAGAHAICDAFRMVRDGTAKMMLAGGSDACIDAVSLEALSRAAGTNSVTDKEVSESRHLGPALGEGAAILVLEEHEHALARRAHIYAEVRGSASSGRVVDVAQPADPRGSLSAQEVTDALADAELECKHINLIISSASSSSQASCESGAHEDGSIGFDKLPMIHPSTAFGHIPGAAGAFEALIAALALDSGRLPQLDTSRPSNQSTGPGDYCHAALVTCDGFGGASTAVVLTSAAKTSKFQS